MNEDIFFIFSSKGKTVAIQEPEYGITNYEGLEATDYEIEEQENINGIGAKKKKKRLLPRPISLEFDYLGPDEKKREKRKELVSFFSPFHPGELTIHMLGEERRIQYEVTELETSSKVITEPLSFLLELTCMDPMMKDVVQTSHQIATWVGGWTFPFTLPFTLKKRGEPRINIINQGDVETPVSVEFHGPAKNPYIKNLTTGKMIKITAELTSDQTLYIDTTFGKNTVEIEEKDVRRDASQLLSVDSRFWRLQEGDNMVEYGSDDELQDNSVIVRYHNLYTGI